MAHGLRSDEQNVSGASKTVVSGLAGKVVRARGALVNDADHRFKVELHPLDSVAYPVDRAGAPLDATPGSPGWPATEVIWRVGA